MSGGAYEPPTGWRERYARKLVGTRTSVRSLTLVRQLARFVRPFGPVLEDYADGPPHASGRRWMPWRSTSRRSRPASRERASGRLGERRCHNRPARSTRAGFGLNLGGHRIGQAVEGRPTDAGFQAAARSPFAGVLTGSEAGAFAPSRGQPFRPEGPPPHAQLGPTAGEAGVRPALVRPRAPG